MTDDADRHDADRADAGRADARRSDRAREIAQRLWTNAARDVIPDGDVDATIDLLFTKLDISLRRWIGAEGYAALLTRAGRTALAQAPALRGLRDVVTDAQNTRVSPRFSAEELHAAVLVLLETMVRQLGEIIGDEMTYRLFESGATSAASPPRRSDPTETD